jgi:site-specific DNA recombinase
MKAIILARVSSKEQEDNNSIPAQVRRLNDYAVRFGLEIIDTYQLVESSSKANRTKFNELITRIKSSKEPIALVTDTVDRLQRSFRDSVVLDDIRKQGKLELHFMREGLVISKDSNSSEILRWDMGVMFAKSYVTQLSDNVRRSQDEKLKNGEWLSKAPFGYTNIRRGRDESWIEPDANADAVRTMFAWYATGAFSMQRVRVKLAEELGIHKSLSNVDKILKNSFYYGVMKVKGASIAHNYSPLISEEVFASAQRIAGRFNKQPFKFAGLPYFYRGLITCGTCGCRITPERSKGYIYYHCTQHNGKHGASYIREEELTRQFMEALDAIRPTQKQYDDVMSALKLSHEDKVSFQTRQQSTFNAELTKTEKKIERLHDLYLEDDISKEDYHTKQQSLRNQRDSINRKLTSIDKASDTYYENAEITMNLVRNASEILKSSKIERRRQIINIVFQNLELHDDQLRWKYKKPFDTMASYTNHSSWLGWRDSNPRMLEPEPSALPLGDIPIPSEYIII